MNGEKRDPNEVPRDSPKSYGLFYKGLMKVTTRNNDDSSFHEERFPFLAGKGTPMRTFIEMDLYFQKTLLFDLSFCPPGLDDTKHEEDLLFFSFWPNLRWEIDQEPRQESITTRDMQAGTR